MVVKVLHILFTTKILVALAFATLPEKYDDESLSSVFNTAFKTTDPSDWRVIEALAEEHPYIVALLNGVNKYLCTGSIISKWCIITSGNCIRQEPEHVAVSTAVFSSKVHNKNTIFNVASAVIHGDYIFELHATDANATRMHSNIGLVFVDRPTLDVFINVANMGNYFASELSGKRLTAIGYGRVGLPNIIALQFQGYQQIACMNPKWYYCICGIEYTTMFTSYIEKFGTGAPVLYSDSIAGISAAATGTLSMKSLGIKYNIFTVVGPYLPWIEKSTSTSKITLRREWATRSKSDCLHQSLRFYLLILISKAVL